MEVKLLSGHWKYWTHYSKKIKTEDLEDQRDVLNTNCWDSKQKDVPAQQLPKLPPISEPKAGNIALLYTYTRTYLINKKLCLCRCEWTLPPPSTGATNSVSEDRNQAQDSIKTKEWKTCSSANVSIFNVLVLKGFQFCQLHETHTG